MASNDYDDLLESFMNNSQKYIMMIKTLSKKARANSRVLTAFRQTAIKGATSCAKNQTARNRLNRAAVKMRLKLLRESFLAEWVSSFLRLL